MQFKIRELPVRNGNVPKITYIVTFDNSVFFAKELTRHLFLQQASGYEYDDIIWGGVLKEDGTWERKSFDFGDAPTRMDRDVVVTLINSAAKDNRVLLP